MSNPWDGAVLVKNKSSPYDRTRVVDSKYVAVAAIPLFLAMGSEWFEVKQVNGCKKRNALY